MFYLTVRIQKNCRAFKKLKVLSNSGAGFALS